MSKKKSLMLAQIQIVDLLQTVSLSEIHDLCAVLSGNISVAPVLTCSSKLNDLLLPRRLQCVLALRDH